MITVWVACIVGAIVFTSGGADTRHARLRALASAVIALVPATLGTLQLHGLFSLDCSDPTFPAGRCGEATVLRVYSIFMAAAALLAAVGFARRATGRTDVWATKLTTGVLTMFGLWPLALIWVGRD